MVVIAGTTASGKTELALQLARALDGELVGADSVQVYRGFDVGSAKPTPDELGGVRHHLIDVIDPDEAIDAARFAALADRAIAEIVARGKRAIVVGGTGLWLRALVRGLVVLPTPDPEVRAALEREVERDGAPRLHARLASLDPRAAAAIHPNDALRIVRALEVHAQTGRPLGELRYEHGLGAPRYRTLFVSLDREREALRARIEARVDAMLARGWVAEVEALLARWPADARAFGSVGYREIVAHLREGVELATTRTSIVRSTWVYTRRQRTWFRSEPGIDLHLDAAALDVAALVERAARHLEDPSAGGASRGEGA
ncbi:MAG: tRNA (adenosine(37)-N6)-dimethylallyltransferase MiaA [Sandaracinaceae bacterium]|nr:tRNA (adenosine(37)-N6)-dimethylallyltransferase MiaA [Sandaracinaceae bacterium]